MVLGAVIEAASGESYQEYVRVRLLRPLGMSCTDFIFSATGCAEAATASHPWLSLETAALPFLVSVLATSTLMTWVYRSTGGSVLLTILLHGAANVWPGLVGGAASAVMLAWAQAVLLTLVASVVVARYGPDLG